MITYEVTAAVDPALAPEYERYMTERHIPDLLATGCFVEAGFARAAEGRYRIRYEAPDEAALQRYLEEHAARLRDHVAEIFPRGITLSRETWTVIQRWPA